MQISKLPTISQTDSSEITIVGAALILKENSVLLVKDKDDPFWKFPGGRLSDDEALIHTVKREVREEIGLDITIKQNEEPIVYSRNCNDDGKPEICIIFHYPVRSIEGEVHFNDKDTEDAKYFELNVLPENVGENVRLVLKQVSKSEISDLYPSS